jgi:hypothetical protein
MISKQKIYSRYCATKLHLRHEVMQEMREGSLEPFCWGVLNHLKLLDVERLQVVSVEEKVPQDGIRYEPGR